MNAIKKAWSWVPTLYFAQGLPYTIAIMITPAMFKSLGLNNTEIGIYTSWLYLPWLIKPLWSPIVDNVNTKRGWVILTQFVLGASIAALGLTLPLDHYIKYTLICLWLIAFSSATHDIAADGFYMHALNSHAQSFFVGIRNTAYRIAMVTGQGGMVALAGYLQNGGKNIHQSWMWVIVLAAGIFLLIAIYHNFILPHPKSDETRTIENLQAAFKAFANSALTFIKKPQIGVSLTFIFFFRFGEAQLSRMSQPFLLDTFEMGGLGLNLQKVGVMYGSIGVIGLIVGGVLGGFLASRNGLKFWIWPMVLALNIPNLAYVYMAYAQPENTLLIGSMITLEQFGYGFGFTAFTLYLLQFCEGPYKTSHYAIATGLMAFGMMVPGMISGWMQEILDYKLFFIYVMLCTIPGMLLIPFLKIDPKFGKN